MSDAPTISFHGATGIDRSFEPSGLDAAVVSHAQRGEEFSLWN